MGLLQRISRLSQRWLGDQRFDDAHTSAGGLRICRFEEIESRLLMAADLHVGASYYDPASGLDTVPNVFQIEFKGGAAGTQLTHLQINGSKDGGPLTFNDAIFDTAAGGLGAYGFSPLSIVSHDGFQVTSSHVVDGGTALDLHFSGFQAGMKLVFTIDADQVLFVDPAPGDVEVDAVDEGAEFQRSHFIADFTAPHYHDLTTSTQFWDKYDANFAAADQSSGSQLDLPTDRYNDPAKDQSVLTAGAVATAQQTPLPDSIAGVVFVDNNLNNHQDTGEPGIGNVTLTLFQFNGTGYVSTGLTTVTDPQGNYKFGNLLPGQYRVVETQPAPYFSVGAAAGTVDGAVRGVVTTPDIVSDINLLGGEDSVQNDFAEALPNSISGHVGNDVTGDCEKNPDTPGISGVVMHLLNADGTVIATTTTDVNGNYKFDNLVAGAYTVLEEQPAGWLEDDAHVGSAGGLVVNDDKIAQIALTTNINAVHYDFCEVLPVSISGHVGIDTIGGQTANSTMPPISGVTMQLLDSAGNVIGTTTTDTNGNYAFTGMAPGTYGVRELQPIGYFDGDTEAGSKGGTVADDRITSVVLLSGMHATDYDFSELLPNSISGHVGNDVTGDCEKNPGTPGISGVVMHLLNADGTVIATTTTDDSGNYKFDNLPAGTYTVLEEQPAGWLEDDAHAGSAGGLVVNDDKIARITLTTNVHGVEYDFCEVLPVSISGHVGIDTIGGQTANSTMPPISGVTIQLLDSAGNVIGTTTTDANGNYAFTGMAPGTYGVHEIQPAGYFDGDTEAGSKGGTVTDDRITSVVLLSGMHATDYDFSELLPNSISGHVGNDVTGDCEKNPDTPGISGVVMHLLNADDTVIATTTTDDSGNYKFDHLPAGTYTVLEEQPAGWLEDDAHAGSAGGLVVNDDKISRISLTANVQAVAYDFCEVLPVSISGHVGIDTIGGQKASSTMPPISGVTIQLLDSNGNVMRTTTTDANGNYTFTGMAPGTYGIHEVQPAGYVDGDTEAGSKGGTVSDDRITSVVLLSGMHATDYDFSELLPSSISGHVGNDVTGDCENNPATPGISGVVMHLLNADGTVIATTTTDESGNYKFDNLAAGTYTVLEEQPAGWLEDDAHAGSAGGLVVNDDKISLISLTTNMNAVHYDFCEVLPVSISGHVGIDVNGDCQTNPNTPPIAGVVIHLLDASDKSIATTTTDANGNYVFDNLAPGTYGVHEDQPAGYFQDDSDVGSVGGVVSATDTVTRIVLTSGAKGVHYNFCETRPATIAGYVFQDGPPIPVQNAGDAPDVKALRDGKLTPDDTLLPGVTLQLRDGVTGQPILGSAALPGYYAANQPITTVTDQNGHYEFRGLAPGVYAVFDIKPSGYFSGIDTHGSTGGIVISTLVVTDPAVLAQLVAKPQDDALIGIGLTAGADSINNNFSVVVTTTGPQIFVFPGSPVGSPLVVAPPIVMPFVQLIAPLPISFPYLVMQQITRVGGALYTWHLSVVNAGQPRQSQPDAVAQLISVQPGDEVLWQDDLDEGEWLLAPEVRSTGKIAGRKLRFGIRGGIPITGDFDGDGKTEVGIFKDGSWFIDLNNNGVWDAGDLWAKLGHRGDRPVTGDWDGDGKTDIGIYGPAWSGDPRAVAHEPGIPDPHNPNTNVHKNIPRQPEQTAKGDRKMKLTSHGKPRADLIDHVFFFGTPGDVPVVGDWNGDGTHTIAVFRSGTWWRDTDGNGKRSKADVKTHFGQSGDLPVVGDFNGDGIDELGVYRNGIWYIDTNGNGVIDAEDQVFQLGGPGDKPIVGDWNGDGKAEPGVYHDSPAPTTKASAE